MAGDARVPGRDDDARTAQAGTVLLQLAVAGLALAAGVYVLKTPPLRRAAWRLTSYALFTALPGWIWRETVRAWAESAHN